MSVSPALAGALFELDSPKLRRVQGYASGGDGRPLLLIHSVNAVASAFEVRPLFDHYGSRRPTYALDLPGFGLSDRSDRNYTPRLMTDAVRAIVGRIREEHAGQAVDALGVSLGCEFVARAAAEEPGAFRSLALVSPTGFQGGKRRMGPPESTLAIPGTHAVVSLPFLSDGLFNNLTRPSVIRYFLERTWGGKNIDEALWAYDVQLGRQKGAKNAPLCFLSGQLFSDDITRVYESLKVPVWMSHGVRGDFVDYRGADGMKSRSNWSFTELQTGAMPYFELPQEFIATYDQFLTKVDQA